MALRFEGLVGEDEPCCRIDPGGQTIVNKKLSNSSSALTLTVSHITSRDSVTAIQRALVPFHTRDIDPEISDIPLPHICTTLQHLAKSHWNSQELTNISACGKLRRSDFSFQIWSKFPFFFVAHPILNYL